MPTHTTSATPASPRLHIIFYVDSVTFTRAILDGTGSLGGSESACMALARGLAARQHDVHIFTPKISEGAEGVDSYGVQWHPAEILPQVLKFAPPDVFVSLRMPGVFNHRTGAKLNVLWAQDLMVPGYEGQIEPVLFQVDQIHYVSQYHRAQWEGQGSVVNQVRSYVTDNPFDVGAAAKVTAGTLRGRYRLVHISRPERGLDAVLRYWPAIKEKYPEATLTICRYNSMYDAGGWGRVCADYDQKVAMVNGMVGGIEYAGELGKPDLYRLLASCNALFYPTSQPGFAETNCIAVAEAQACGLPVIASDLGAIPETLKPGAGILVPGHFMNEDTKSGFLDAVDRVFGDNGWSHVARQMSREGQRQSAQFDMGVVAAKWEAEVVGQFRERASTNRVGLLRQFLHDDNHAHGLRLAQIIIDSHVGSSAEPPFYEAVEAKMLCERVIRQEDLTADQYAQFAIQDPLAEMQGNARLQRAAHEISQSLLDLTEAKRLGAIGAAISQADGDDGNPPQAAWNVLDVAGGNGTFALLLLQSRPDIRVTLIDFSDGVLRMARKGAEALGVADRLTTEQVSPWDYAARFKASNVRGPFDAVFAGEFLEHVEKPWEVLGLLEWLATPGAMVLLTTPCGPFAELLDPTVPRHRGHVHSFTLRDWTTMLDGRTSGVEYMEMGGSPWGTPVGTWLVSFQAERDASRPFPSIDYDHLLLTERPYQSVVVGMIVKDAVSTIHKALHSVYRVADRIIVSDTGSTDGTLAILDQWAAFPHGKLQVYRDSFPDDFGKARNRTLDLAREAGADWFLWFDSDEELIHPENIRFVVNHQSPFVAYSIRQQHTLVDQPGFADNPCRLFRAGCGLVANGSDIRFYGMVHEQPGHQGPDQDGVLGHDRPLFPALQLVSPQSPLFWHAGYSTESVRRQKMFGRNRPLLLRELNGHADHPPRMLAWAFEIRDQLNLARYAESDAKARRHLHTAMAIFEAKFKDPKTPAYVAAREWYEQALDQAKMGFTILHGITIGQGPKVDPPKARRLRVRELRHAYPILADALKVTLDQAQGKLADTRPFHEIVADREAGERRKGPAAPIPDTPAGSAAAASTNLTTPEPSPVVVDLVP